MFDPITLKLSVDPLILSALKEDVTSEDVTTNSVMREACMGQVDLICKEDGTEDYECNSCFHYFISESDSRRIFGTIVWKYFWN